MSTLPARSPSRQSGWSASPRQLAEQRKIQDVGAVDELARAIRHLIDRITTATYGYGGLFSDRNVDEVALDQLRRFDESLLQGAQELEAPVTAP
ncbi:MAG: hypothetical protein KatS3mg059_0803 [Thermomicrobiales bacterium]|nr:MAG: hypothetical protein KatS3mg059_0803 [Thermomicrobiales bacterium]